jgi:hypothetical protein
MNDWLSRSSGVFHPWPYDPDESLQLVDVRDGRKTPLVRQLMGVKECGINSGPDGLLKWNQPIRSSRSGKF